MITIIPHTGGLTTPSGLIAMAANTDAQVGQRPIPDEPMYVLAYPLAVLRIHA